MSDTKLQPPGVSRSTEALLMTPAPAQLGRLIASASDQSSEDNGPGRSPGSVSGKGFRPRSGPAARFNVTPDVTARGRRAAR